MPIIRNISIYNYTQYAMLISCCIAIIVSFANRKKFKELKYIHIYPIASFFQAIIYYFLYQSRISFYYLDKTNQAIINVFIVFEFLLAYHFYWNILSSRIIKLIMQVLLFVFCIVSISY